MEDKKLTEKDLYVSAMENNLKILDHIVMVNTKTTIISKYVSTIIFTSAIIYDIRYVFNSSTDLKWVIMVNLICLVLELLIVLIKCIASDYNDWYMTNLSILKWQYYEMLNEKFNVSSEKEFANDIKTLLSLKVDDDDEK